MVSDLRSIILSIAPLLITIMLITMGHGLIGTGTAVRLDADGFSTNVIGLVGTTYAIGFMIGTLIVPHVIGRVGHIRVFAAFASLFLISALVQSLYVGPISWSVLRFIAGFCIAGIFIMTEGWINASISNAIRGQVLSIYISFNYFGLMMGQALIAMIDPATAMLFVVSAILISLSVVPLTLANIHAPTPVKTPRFTLKKLFKISPLGFLSVFLGGILGSVLYNFLPVLAREVDPRSGFIAVIMLALIISGFVFQMPAGRLSDKIDRRYVIIGSAIILIACGIAGIILPLTSQLQLIFVVIAVGAFVPIFYSIGVAHTTDFIDFNEMVAASAGLLLVYGLGTVIGPMLGGQMMNWLGSSAGIFTIVLMLGIILAAFGIYRSIVGDRVDEEDKGDFQIMRPTTTAAFSFDPRIEEDQYDLDLGDDGTAYLTASAAGLESASYQSESEMPEAPENIMVTGNPNGTCADRAQSCKLHEQRIRLDVSFR
jgi:MFS family permease